MPPQSQPIPIKASDLAASLKPLGDRLVSLAQKLTQLGDKPTPDALTKEIGKLAAAIQQATAPPSTTTEKADLWPADLADEVTTKELDWGLDPEGLRRG